MTWSTLPGPDPDKLRAWQARSKPIRRVSKKRAKTNRVRRRVLHDAYGDRPLCAACQTLRDAGISTGCDGWADDGHELLSRGRGGSIVDVSNVIPVGRPCHAWITTHGTRAEELGLALPSSRSRGMVAGDGDPVRSIPRSTRPGDAALPGPVDPF